MSEPFFATSPTPPGWETPKCRVSLTADPYWCIEHNSAFGDTVDGWAGCSRALTTDLRTIANFYDYFDSVTENDDYAAAEAAAEAMVEPGLAISALILRARGEA